MMINVNQENKTFHLSNDSISYIMTVLPNGQVGQLYFGKKIRHKEDFSYLLEMQPRAMSSYVYEGRRDFSLEHIKQEYAVHGTTDYRRPAIEVVQKNGSRYSDFVYTGYEVMAGKPELEKLPATYTESPEEAETLVIHTKDSLTGVELDLMYTIFAKGGIIARSAKITNLKI